ncbi:hypothetical protein pb186bvf_016464 [Paramecium bursaria]
MNTQQEQRGSKFFKCVNRRVVFKKKITQNQCKQYCSVLGTDELLKTCRFVVEIPSTNEQFETDLVELNLHQADKDYTINDLKLALLIGDLQNVRTYYYMIDYNHTNILEDDFKLKFLKFDSSIIIKFIDNNVSWRHCYENQFGRVEFNKILNYAGLIELSQDHLLYDPQIKQHIHLVTMYNFGSSYDRTKKDDSEFERSDNLSRN